MKVTITLDIDFSLLREQKGHLLYLIDDEDHLTSDTRVWEGIVHLIDGIQDAAVDQGNATEEQVFGKLTEEVEE